MAPYSSTRLLLLLVSRKRVQRKFLHHDAYKLNVPCPPHDHTPIQRLFSLESLADRRHSTNLSFLSNPLSSRIDCPELLSRISFNVPSRRTPLSFHSIFHSHSRTTISTLLSFALCALPITTPLFPFNIQAKFPYCILFVFALTILNCVTFSYYYIVTY